MLINVIGKTGSGKSLYQSFKAYSELTRIMRQGKPLPWFLSIGYRFPYFLKSISYYSRYDYVYMNSDFDDGRGNYCRFNLTDKKCDSGGYVKGISDIPELYDKQNCLVFLDEAGTYFSNRDWDKMPPSYRLFLITHRHNCTSKYKRFDIYILATQIYLIRPLFGFSKDPTRPAWYHRIPAIRIWTYWQHEVLQRPPPTEFTPDGVPIPIPIEERVESLDFYTWYYFGKKYYSSYDTLSEVRELIRNKGK